MKKLTIRDLIMCGLFAAITAVLSQISIPIPFSPVPFTMQTLAVALCGVILGARKGFIAQLIYIALGVVGLPVFSGFAGGMSKILGPTGGFIISFPIMALIIGYLSDSNINKLKLGIGMTVSLIISYAIGALQMSFVLGISFGKALTIGVIPFVILDFIKMGIVTAIGEKLKKRVMMSIIR